MAKPSLGFECERGVIPGAPRGAVDHQETRAARQAVPLNYVLLPMWACGQSWERAVLQSSECHVCWCWCRAGRRYPHLCTPGIRWDYFQKRKSSVHSSLFTLGRRHNSVGNSHPLLRDCEGEGGEDASAQVLGNARHGSVALQGPTLSISQNKHRVVAAPGPPSRCGLPHTQEHGQCTLERASPTTATWSVMVESCISQTPDHCLPP